jgi:phage baseplate assembly protein W
MDPEFGCDIQQFLFAPIDTWHAGQLSKEITRAIGKYEPRALELNVVVNMDFDNNEYEVEVEFRPATSQEQISLLLNLEKIR